jgi:hypothetical protein
VVEHRVHKLLAVKVVLKLEERLQLAARPLLVAQDLLAASLLAASLLGVVHLLLLLQNQQVVQLAVEIVKTNLRMYC